MPKKEINQKTDFIALFIKYAKELESDQEDSYENKFTRKSPIITICSKRIEKSRVEFTNVHNYQPSNRQYNAVPMPKIYEDSFCSKIGLERIPRFTSDLETKKVAKLKNIKQKKTKKSENSVSRLKSRKSNHKINNRKRNDMADDPIFFEKEGQNNLNNQIKRFRGVHPTYFRTYREPANIREEDLVFFPSDQPTETNDSAKIIPISPTSDLSSPFIDTKKTNHKKTINLSPIKFDESPTKNPDKNHLLGEFNNLFVCKPGISQNKDFSPQAQNFYTSQKHSFRAHNPIQDITKSNVSRIVKLHNEATQINNVSGHNMQIPYFEEYPFSFDKKTNEIKSKKYCRKNKN